jgi:diamine N-acetyltransferase
LTREPSGALEEPVLNIRGQLVGLGPHFPGLTPLYYSWLNNFEILETSSFFLRPVGHDYIRSWLKETSTSPNHIGFTVYALEELVPIGIASLMNLDHFHRTADISLVIARSDYWGRGFGSEAVELLVRYGFRTLLLHNIMAVAFASNTRAIRIYEKAGFSMIGRRTGARRTRDGVEDLAFMERVVTANDRSLGTSADETH